MEGVFNSLRARCDSPARGPCTEKQMLTTLLPAHCWHPQIKGALPQEASSLPSPAHQCSPLSSVLAPSDSISLYLILENSEKNKGSIYSTHMADTARYQPTPTAHSSLFHSNQILVLLCIVKCPARRLHSPVTLTTLSYSGTPMKNKQSSAPQSFKFFCQVVTQPLNAFGSCASCPSCPRCRK